MHDEGEILHADLSREGGKRSRPQSVETVTTFAGTGLNFRYGRDNPRSRPCRVARCKRLRHGGKVLLFHVSRDSSLPLAGRPSARHPLRWSRGLWPRVAGGILRESQAAPERFEGSHRLPPPPPFKPCVRAVKGPVVAEAFIVALALAVFAGLMVFVRLVISVGSALFS